MLRHAHLVGTGGHYLEIADLVLFAKKFSASLQIILNTPELKIVDLQTYLLSLGIDGDDIGSMLQFVLPPGPVLKKWAIVLTRADYYPVR